jgi:hypothetical protein
MRANMPSFPHREFLALDPDGPWTPVAGYPPGIWYREVAGTLEENGLRARLVKFDAGAFTTEPVVHDTAELVLIYSGDLIVGSDANGHGGTSFAAPTFAIRPHRIAHGPFASRTGCIMLELHARSD